MIILKSMWKRGLIKGVQQAKKDQSGFAFTTDLAIVVVISVFVIAGILAASTDLFDKTKAQSAIKEVTELYLSGQQLLLLQGSTTTATTITSATQKAYFNLKKNVYGTAPAVTGTPAAPVIKYTTGDLEKCTVLLDSINILIGTGTGKSTAVCTTIGVLELTIL